jgi:hypothetical protein
MGKQQGMATVLLHELKDPQAETFPRKSIYEHLKEVELRANI